MVGGVEVEGEGALDWVDGVVVPMEVEAEEGEVEGRIEEDDKKGSSLEKKRGYEMADLEKGRQK